MFKISSALYSVYNASPSVARGVVASIYSYWSGRKKYGGQYAYWWKLLNQSQWWVGWKLRDFQIKRLQEIVRFADEHCPFYHEAMREAGVRPSDVDSLEAMKRLPIINKQVVRDHYDGVKTSLAADKHLVFYTSGTTGASLHVPVTEEALQREYAFRWQYQSVAGAKLGDRFAFFTGHSIVPVQRAQPPFFVRNYTENSIMFSLYHMSDATMKSYVEAFNGFRPQYVYGYPSGIYVLADFIQRNGLTVLPPKAVFTASEKLHRYQREVIEKVFQAPVYEWYGQVELTVNLHECDHHRLHVKEEYGFLELLKDDGTDAGPGEMGTVVATGWGNKAFPLIRYNTGDNMILAKQQQCRCGRGGRIIEEIVGRDDDFILTPEGRYVGRLDFVLKPIDTVKEGQIVQESIDSVVVRVVPLPQYSVNDEQRIIQELRARIGDTIGIRVETIAQVPRTKSGKIRYVISHVTSGYSKGR